jgi:hypothetical protein
VAKVGVQVFVKTPQLVQTIMVPPACCLVLTRDPKPTGILNPRL